MPRLVDQFPALLGVVLGAVGAMASSSLTDHLRWRRQQSTRWDERRLEAYVTFAATLKEILTLAFRLTVERRAGATQLSIDRDAAMELLPSLTVRRTKDWESLLLLADGSTVSAGRSWRDSVSTLLRLALQDSWDETEWQTTVETVNRSRDEFHIAARRSLGVGGDYMEQSPFL